MSGEGVSHEHVSSWAGVQKALVSSLKEPLIGVEPRLQQLAEELSENPAAIDASFIQAVRVEQVHADPLFQIGLCDDRGVKWARRKDFKQASITMGSFGKGSKNIRDIFMQD